MKPSFYNATDSYIPKNVTYRDVIACLESYNGKLYVAVHYPTNTHEWLPVDKAEYLRQLKLISNPEVPYPCLFEVEPDNEMYIHPRANNS